MEDDSKVVVQRMSNLVEWEMYRFADNASDEVVCKIVLRVDESANKVEYGIWRADEAEPSATGRIERDREGAWQDGERKSMLAQIAEIYEQGIPEGTRGLDFQIGDVEDGDDLEENDQWNDDEDEDAE